MKQWNNIFKANGRVFETVQEDMPGITQFFRKRNVLRVLDLGCGSGRHTVYLSRKGFNVHGLDSSKEGLKMTKSWLKQENLAAELVEGSIHAPLPYENDYFCSVVSTQVLYHGTMENNINAIKQIKRVLKPGGIIFLTFIIDRGNKRIFKKIAHKTYLPIEGPEKGLAHYFYDKKTLLKHYSDFNIMNLWVTGSYYCLLGELPA